MHLGKFADGEHVLRAKIDMASPNINMRDPAMYRIRHARTTAPATTGASTPPTTGARRVGRARKHHALALHARVRGPPPALRMVQRALAEDWTGYDA